MGIWKVPVRRLLDRFMALMWLSVVTMVSATCVTSRLPARSNVTSSVRGTSAARLTVMSWFCESDRYLSEAGRLSGKTLKRLESSERISRLEKDASVSPMDDS